MLNEGVRVIAAPACLFCATPGDLIYEGLRDRLFAAPGIWSSRRCPRCGLHWLDPQPIPSDVGALYTSYYTHDSTAPALDGVRSLMKESVLAGAFGYKELENGWRQRLAGRLFSAFPPVRDRVGMGVDYLPAARRGRMLDVGCGSGLFLYRMKRLGWEVRGIDPDPHAARIAREQYHIDVTVGDMAAGAFPDSDFDVVTLNHVIEHAVDPVKLLAACGAVLKPGGRMVIITPNIESLGHRALGASWLPLDPPRHLFLFSAATLIECVRRAGLRAETSRTSARSAAAMWTGSRQIAQTGRGSVDVDASLRFHPLSLLFQCREELACARGTAVGEELLVTATRNSSEH